MEIWSKHRQWTDEKNDEIDAQSIGIFPGKKHQQEWKNFLKIPIKEDFR